MNKAELLEKLETVEKIATTSKFNRMLLNPIKYIKAVLFRILIYKRTKKSKTVKTKTFFDQQMSVLLPASTDIYLTGGKSHNSEIRLAKFIIKNLNSGDTFVDVGAHYGYFTLLAASILKEKGKVVSFEASENNYNILEKNTQNISNVEAINKAISDQKGTIEFYEFPNLYSEYNSINAEQFENEEWFQRFSPKKIMVETIPLSPFFKRNFLFPKLIKIDVEGAELKVISGLLDFLKTNTPIIIMEYLNPKRKNAEHQKAVALLARVHYKSYIIDNEGALKLCTDLDNHLESNDLESDNIVFMKAGAFVKQ